MTSGVQANVRIAPSVIPTLQKLPRTQQAAVVAAIGLIGKEPGTPLELLHAGETRQYLAAVPKADADAPVVVYRQLQDREGGGYLVTGLSDRDTFRAYERPGPAGSASPTRPWRGRRISGSLRPSSRCACGRGRRC